MVVEAAVERDLGDGLAGLSELVGGDENPQADDVLAWADPKAFLEQAFELALRQSGLSRELGNGKGIGVVFLDELDHLYDGIVAVLFCSLVILDDAANACDRSRLVEKRILVSDEPLGKPVSGREKLHEFEERFAGIDDGLVVAAEFVGHVFGKNLVVEFSGQLFDGRETAMFEKAMVAHDQSALGVFDEEHQFGNMFEQTVELAAFGEFRKPLVGEGHGEKIQK